MIIFLLCDKFYDNVILMWIYNEYVILMCWIKMLLKFEFVFCDKSWSGIFLFEGNVIIEVNVCDKLRNFVLFYLYIWYNSKLIISECKF